MHKSGTAVQHLRPANQAIHKLYYILPKVLGREGQSGFHFIVPGDESMYGECIGMCSEDTHRAKQD